MREEEKRAPKKRERELWTQEPFLISTFWFLGFNLQFTDLFSSSSQHQQTNISNGWCWNGRREPLYLCPFPDERHQINFHFLLGAHQKEKEQITFLQAAETIIIKKIIAAWWKLGPFLLSNRPLPK